LRTWVRETDQPDSQLYVGPWTSAFTLYRLEVAGWDWSWFDQVRRSVLAIGVAGWGSGMDGDAAVRVVVNSEKWARPINLAVSSLMIVFGFLTWSVGATQTGVLF
jgi:hypothetical protein